MQFFCEYFKKNIYIYIKINDSQLVFIDNYAFSTSSITSFEIPLPLTNFTPFTFANCSKLEFISIQISDENMKNKINFTLLIP